MMLFSLTYLFSVLIFRYNPLEKGVFCLIHPRYVMFYQIGIAGFYWSVLLLIGSATKKWVATQKRIISIAIILTILVLSHWVQNYSRANNISKFLNSKYPEVSNNIRKKLIDNNISVPWSNQPGRNINRELKFLYNNKLNVFAPNYPFLTVKKKRE
jgi:hypothetical protein